MCARNRKSSCSASSNRQRTRSRQAAAEEKKTEWRDSRGEDGNRSISQTNLSETIKSENAHATFWTNSAFRTPDELHKTRRQKIGDEDKRISLRQNEGFWGGKLFLGKAKDGPEMKRESPQVLRAARKNSSGRLEHCPVKKKRKKEKKEKSVVGEP